ncbi:hypothetical protein ACFPH9_00840 [Brevundimonas bullata]
MSLNILVTGQVRDPVVFARLMDGVQALRSKFARIVYSTWSDELARLPTLVSKACLPEGLQCVDAGSPFFGATIGNRDVVSFVAQHRQILAGLAATDSDAHIIRLRADFDCVSIENFEKFIDLLIAVWKDSSLASRALVCGADDFSPFFFEDRMLLLSPKQAVRLANLKLDDSYRFDYFNLFPEFQFYASLVGAVDTQFARHDHRYRQRAGFGEAFCDYDFMAFGPHYEDQVRLYLGAVTKELTFLSDAADIVGKRSEYDVLEKLGLLPRNFRIGDMREYCRTWLVRSEKYSNSMPSDSVSDIDVEARKRLYNNLYLNYFSGNSGLVASAPLVDAPFTDAAAELVGVSKLLVGGGDEALEELQKLFDRGARGFELCFYLIRELAERGDKAEFDKVADRTMKAFASIDRMVSHVEYCRILVERRRKAAGRTAKLKARTETRSTKVAVELPS